MPGLEFHVGGTIQGVGFRPFVYRLAHEEGLAGSVRNTGAGVAIQVWGSPAKLSRFENRLTRDLPTLAIIDTITTTLLAERPSATVCPDEFLIAVSDPAGGRVAITPDAAICADCLEELRDPADHRYRYPFVNCLQCGPRFSIVEGLPYDRERTSMRRFTMCADCRVEYTDPRNRRYHAQPIACPACGPRLWLEGPVPGELLAEDVDAIDQAVNMLRDGQIVAVKGLGGFHLAVLATNAGAVDRLRTRKRRSRKPFALMVRDIAVAERTAIISDAVRKALIEPAAPIVLAPWRTELPGIAPGLEQVGLMLPYTPLHAILLQAFDEPLVMTSGNRSGEPQVIDLEAARDRLGRIADGFLTHDRPIVNRADDSLVQIMDGQRQVVRRARGLAPRPIRLPPGFPKNHDQVLALGGDLKNAFALARGSEIVLSQHIGDLAEPSAVADFRQTLTLLAELTGFTAERIVADPHPAYRSALVAKEIADREAVPLDFVPHHHAHAASLMVEHGVPLDHQPIPALALDGVGLGENGALWGCELLYVDYRCARRLGGLRPTALLGGDRAAIDPWRNLAARLADVFGDDLCAWPRPLIERLEGKPVDTLLAARRAGINALPASSAGRLFDAVSAALDLTVDRQDYEGEAAMRVQAAALRGDPESNRAMPAAYTFSCSRSVDGLVLDPGPIWNQIAADLTGGVDVEIVASRFHAGLANGLLALVQAAWSKPCHGDIIALTGGTFQNTLLAKLLRQRLTAEGFHVVEHRAVPAGDGGLALGQAAVSIARTVATDGGT
ncbi:MAG: carbamoyltransferase HypF [Geminicoccaceae bacterium]